MEICNDFDNEDCVVFIGGILKKDASNFSEEKLKKEMEEAIFELTMQTIAGIKLKAYEAQLQQEIQRKKKC